MTRSGALVLLVAVALHGCVESPEAPGLPDGLGEQGLDLQGIDDPTFYPDLAAHPLAPESFEEVESLAAAIRTPQAQGLLGYIVNAAFGEGQRLTLRVDGQTLSYEGHFGLAREWASEPCDRACQEWITAYLAASINAYGVHVLVSYRPSEAGSIETSERERERFPVQEGAFFGNIFLPEPQLFVCRGSGHDPYYMSMRACTNEGSPCLLDLVGPCGAVDGLFGPTSRHACEVEDEELAGAYRSCHDRLPDPETGEHPPGTRTFERVITLYLKDARFVD